MSMIKVTVSNNIKRETVIVSDDTTLRSVLESNQIDYTRGMTNLDGTPLQPGALDKTFAEFGITEKCFLSAIVKTDNAASIAVVGESVVITSAITLENYKAVAKYRPKALQLKGGEDGKEVVFVAGITSNPRGSINKVGVEFGSEAHDGTGRATITFDLPRTEGDIKEAVAEYIGSAILDLNKLEAQLPAVIEEIGVERANVMANIDVQ